MNKSALPLIALGVAVTGAALVTPDQALAACANVTSTVNDGSSAYGTDAYGSTTFLAGSLPSISAGLSRVQAQAVSGSTQVPGTTVTPTVTISPSVTVTPSSVSSGCELESFGAPIAAQALVNLRGQLDQALNRLAQLRTLGSARGSSLYLLGGDRARREVGPADAGTPVLKVARTDITFGGDARLNDKWVVGASFGLGNPRLRWPGQTTRVDGYSGNLTAYGSWSPTAATYVSAAYSTEVTHYTLATDDGLTTSQAYGTGVSKGLSVSAGYDYSLGSVSLSPYVRMDEIATRLGSFGTGASAIKGRSGSVSAGSQLQTNVSTSWGLLVPHARVEFTQITGWNIQGGAGNAYAAGITPLPSPNPYLIDRQFGQAGVGLSAVLQRGLSLFTDYDQGFAQKGVSSWRFTLGVRSEL
jgi:outer membrane autotransporter protein